MHKRIDFPGHIIWLYLGRPNWTWLLLALAVEAVYLSFLNTKLLSTGSCFFFFREHFITIFLAIFNNYYYINASAWTKHRLRRYGLGKLSLQDCTVTVWPGYIISDSQWIWLVNCRYNLTFISKIRFNFVFTKICR